MGKLTRRIVQCAVVGSDVVLVGAELIGLFRREGMAGGKLDACRKKMTDVAGRELLGTRGRDGACKEAGGATSTTSISGRDTTRSCCH